MSHYDPIWGLLYRFLVTVVLVFASVGVAAGVGLIVASEWTLGIFRVMNRWISTRGAFAALDRPRSTEQFAHRNRRWIGWALIAGGLFSIVGMLAGVDAAALAAGYAKGDRAVLITILVGTFKWILIVGSAGGLVVGAMLCFFPNALATLERYSNRWFSVRVRSVTRGGDEMRLTLDRLVAAYPGPSGWILACTALGAVAYAIALLFARS
jgi:hypothetical protein